jgi:putative copper resistance protein D
MVLDKFAHSAPTLLDLLGLITCIGALSCRIWVLQEAGNVSNERVVAGLLAGVWKLIGLSASVIVLSSSILLLMRSAEMSGLNLVAGLAVVLRVLFKTNFGHVWLIHMPAAVLLFGVWLVGFRDIYARRYTICMLIIGAIAATRIASGHAATAGDFGLPEISDWLHLMAATIWGGGLITFSVIIFPIVLRLTEGRRTLIAEIVVRFSPLAGIALFIVTAAYKGWFLVGSIEAHYKTTYGKIIMVKITLLLVLVIVGASNRYLSIPNIIGSSESLERENGIVSRLARKVRVKAVLIAALVVCTALLLHQKPAKTLSFAGHARVHGIGR